MQLIYNAIARPHPLDQSRCQSYNSGAELKISRPGRPDFCGGYMYRGLKGIALDAAYRAIHR